MHGQAVLRTWGALLGMVDMDLLLFLRVWVVELSSIPRFSQWVTWLWLHAFPEHAKHIHYATTLPLPTYHNPRIFTGHHTIGWLNGTWVVTLAPYIHHQNLHTQIASNRYSDMAHDPSNSRRKWPTYCVVLAGIL
jgi:hypothetical protein